VLRDGSGNFAAGTITANLTGNVTGNLNGNLTAAAPTAPTAAPGTNTTQIATTAFVQNLAGGLGTMSTQNANNVNITGGSITGITDLAVADGGTGVSTLTANAVVLGNGTSAVQTVAPSTTGNLLTSDGTTWVSAAPSIPALSTATGSAPSYSARAMVTFNGADSTTLPGYRITGSFTSITGTIGNATVTCTTGTPHGLKTGQRVYIDWSVSLADFAYRVTVLSSTQFRVVYQAALTTTPTGAFTIFTRPINMGRNVELISAVANSTSVFIVNFSDPMPDASYTQSYFGTSGNSFIHNNNNAPYEQQDYSSTVQTSSGSTYNTYTFFR
jgi:hypothetical protein